MSDFTQTYVDLLLKQYWEKPRAVAEIELQASTWEAIRDQLASFLPAFDLDTATTDRLDIIGRIVGLPRSVPLVIAKIAFGFDENVNARTFDDKFAVLPLAGVAPFLDKFEPAWTSLELDDYDYRLFLRAKIAKNAGAAYLVSDTRISLQDVINAAFEGQAYALDKKDMTLVLYVSPAFDLERLLAIRQMGLLPKPQGVRYDVIVQAAPGETFGFADNLNSLAFADKSDPGQAGGRFALKVI